MLRNVSFSQSKIFFQYEAESTDLTDFVKTDVLSFTSSLSYCKYYHEILFYLFKNSFIDYLQ